MPSNIYIATEVWPWNQWCSRHNTTLWQQLDPIFTMVKAAGVTGWEPNIKDAALFQQEAQALTRHGLVMKTAYVSGDLYSGAWEETQETEWARLIHFTGLAQAAGAEIILYNAAHPPGDERKSDAQLAQQTERVERLGAELRQRGLRLAYHYHTPEFRDGGREFIHTLLHTNPQNVGLCLDLHWAYRGCGNSFLAVQDLMAQFGDRTIVAHLRQSRNGLIHQTLDEGDIDYRFVLDYLARLPSSVPLILECGVDDETPLTMEIDAALAHSQRYLTQLLNETT